MTEAVEINRNYISKCLTKPLIASDTCITKFHLWEDVNPVICPALELLYL